MMKRRTFLTACGATVLSARSLLAATGATRTKLGICTFSCHQQWRASRDKSVECSFDDGPSFYAYARKLGADGTQVSVASLDEAQARAFRAVVAETGGYYEADVRLPKKESELGRFEQDVKLARAAGATVARSVLSGTRRYETWKTLEEFQTFRAEASQRLAMVEPVLKRHGLKLAIENHKDLTADEQVALMREFDSEWIGINVDTGNNLALLEDPKVTTEALAPYALSVHLKDMALQPDPDGFQLSEVPCGTGFLDLPWIVKTLTQANPELAINLEMATRDPLRIPCLTEGYWATFPDRKASHLEKAMARVQENPPSQPPPSVTGKSTTEIIHDEEANNRNSLIWMHQQLA